MKIILASQSIFRKKALDILGLQYEVVPADMDEKAIRHSNFSEMVTKLAEAKARTIASRFPDALIISGDLVTVCEGKLFEKPADREEAIGMLKFFAGKPVELISCGAVYNTASGKMLSAVDKCTITFRHNLNQDEIMRYVDKYPVTKFAGAFDLEGAMLLGEKYEGNVTITLGFPFDKVIEFIRQNGVEC